MTFHRRPRVALLVTAEVTAIAFYPGYPAFLRSRGWDVAVIADSQGGLEKAPVLSGATIRGVPMKREPAPLHDLWSLIRLLRVVRKFSPDVLVFATPKASLLGAVAGSLLRLPVRSYQLWGLRLETERGVRRSILLFLERVTALLSTEVIANSRSLADMATNIGSTGNRRISVIGAGSGLGVDVDHYSPWAPFPSVDSTTRDFICQTDGLIIGYVGRVHPDKGIDTLIRAASELSRIRGGVGLLIIGDQDGAELDKMLVSLDPGLKVHVVGGVSDVRPYYSVMDVHCLPTLREGFPNVVLEASAMKVPTVTTDATGAVDSVRDGETGRIFPVGNWKKLVEILVQLYDSPALRSRLGEAARSFVKELYDRHALWDLHERHLRAQMIAALGR